MGVLHVAGGTGDRRPQKSFYHLPSYNDRVTMSAVILRNDGPNGFRGAQKSVLKLLDRLRTGSRTIHQGHNRRVAAPIEHLPQTALQRAELPLLGVKISGQGGGLSVHNG